MGNRDYYGVLIDIIELRYMGGNKIVMFKCEWWDVNTPGKGIMVDEYGRTHVNVTCKLKSNEPFVLACQVEQVFYIKYIYKESFLAVCSKDRASKLLQYAASRR